MGHHISCRRKEAVAAVPDSGTVVVKDDQEAQQQQTRWNAWLEKGEHTDAGGTLEGQGRHTASSSVAFTSKNVKACSKHWMWLPPAHPPHNFAELPAVLGGSIKEESIDLKF